MNFVDLESDLGGDITFQMKLISYLINENVVRNFENLKNKKKILEYLDELIELRNHIAHLTYKKDDYKIKQIHKSVKRDDFYKLNKLRNFNYIKLHLDKINYILKELLNIKEDIGQQLNTRIFKRNYASLLNIKKILSDLCLIIERRKRISKIIKTKKKSIEIAENTLLYLQKKLLSKNKKTSELTAKNINNLILSRLSSDKILVKLLGSNLSNEKCNEYCKTI